MSARDGERAWWWGLLRAVVVAAVVITLAVAAYSRGLLATAGPVAAMALVPVLLYVRVRLLRRRTERRMAALTLALGALARTLVAERSLPGAERTSGASDRSLVDALAVAETAQRQLACREGASVVTAMALTDLAAPWRTGTPPAERVGEAVQAAVALRLVWNEVETVRAGG